MYKLDQRRSMDSSAAGLRMHYTVRSYGLTTAHCVFDYFKSTRYH
jgi:hypothetical protein